MGARNDGGIALPPMPATAESATLINAVICIDSIDRRCSSMGSWQSGDIDANGIRLHYTRTGSGKPPIVLAHGVTDDGPCWSPLANELEADYDLIMVDARG